MQLLELDYPINPLQQLFIEKGIELLYKNTIDSFRLRLHNPKTLIEELITVVHSSISGNLTNNDYVIATSSELRRSFDEENHGLQFLKVNKKHYIDIINKTDRSNYKLIIQASKLILKDNEFYQSQLFQHLGEAFSSYELIIAENSDASKKDEVIFQQKKKIVVLTNHLLVELINKGFAKQYLYNVFQILFVRKDVAGRTFNERFEAYKSLSENSCEEFSVIFKVQGSTFQFNEFKKIDNTYELVDKKFRKSIFNKTSRVVNDFLEKFKEETLIITKVNSKDYFKAVEMAVDKISKDLDIFHLGYNDDIYKIDTRCAVIGKHSPSKASTTPTNFQIDGYFRSNSQIFSILLDKIKNIKNNNIQLESYKKILNGIRYYRKGSESVELESKLLNYWIGLEYIFTSMNNEEKTIDRIKNYFPKCHSLIYVKRNLYDFHKTLERLKVSNRVDGYDRDLKYLVVHNNYLKIIESSNNELLKFRTQYFKKWHEDPSRIQDTFRKHQENLKWNLTRLYRIRNEIVHNAAIRNDIQVHISHLKYYLTFILNSILDFMAEQTVDIDNDGKITIDDYFISQDIMLGSLKNSTLSQFLNIKNPSEIFH